MLSNLLCNVVQTERMFLCKYNFHTKILLSCSKLNIAIHNPALDLERSWREFPLICMTYSFWLRRRNTKPKSFFSSSPHQLLCVSSVFWSFTDVLLQHLPLVEAYSYCSWKSVPCHGSPHPCVHNTHELCRTVVESNAQSQCYLVKGTKKSTPKKGLCSLLLFSCVFISALRIFSSFFQGSFVLSLRFVNEPIPLL